MNIRIRSLLSIFATAIAFQACQLDADEDPKFAGFNGVVLSAGTPVPAAAVSLTKDALLFSTTTDIDGRFSFQEIENGAYILTIKSEGQNQQFVQYQKNVDVRAQNDEQNIELPQGVTLLDPSAVTDRSVAIKWTRSDLSNFLEYKLYRHSSTGLDESTGELIHVATKANDTTFTDAGMADSRDYYYRVFVRNTFGFYGGSNIVKVTTPVSNYVRNGDFENDLTEWELYSPGPCAAIAIDPSSPAGNKVLELNIDTEGEVNISAELLQYISQNNFIAGEAYEMSFWAKTDIPGNGQTWIILRRSSDWGGAMVMKSFDSSSSKEWTQYTFEFFAPSLDSPALITIEADPVIPMDLSHTYRVLLDGFDIHKQN